MTIRATSEDDTSKQALESASPNHRPLWQIAQEVQKDWNPVNYAAKPYLDAMLTLSSIRDNYYLDSGDSIVAYFLSNATTWRGEVARRVKAELKAILKAA